MSNWFRRLIIAVIAAGLVGCQTVPFKESLSKVAEALGMQPNAGDETIEVVAEPNKVLPDDLNYFITSGAKGDTSVFPLTPWGRNVTISAGDYYSAASGRRCRVLEVSISKREMEAQLVCENRQGDWVPVRPIIRHG